MTLFLPVVVVALAVVVIRLARGRRTNAEQVTPSSPELQAVARTTSVARLAGVGIGCVVGMAAAYQGSLGRGLLLAAPLGALCVLAGVLVGELSVGSPVGPVRQAALEVRRIRDYVPRALATAVLTAGALLALLLVLTIGAGSPDDMGRAGRELFRRCSSVTAEGHGPWPGSYYAFPLAIVVLCGALAAGVVLTRVVRRPRQSHDLAVDEALRRSAAGAVTAAVGLLVAVPLAGVSTVAGAGLIGIGCRPAWWTIAAIALAVLAITALGLAGACVSALLTRVRQDARPPVPADR